MTQAQLEGLTKTNLVNLFNTRFPSGPAFPVMLRLHTLASSPRQIHSVQRPRTPAASGPRGDAASLVRQVQDLIRSSGANVKAELVGGRWSTRASHNFILIFNGNPTLEAVASLRHIYERVFGSAYALTPIRGYTRIILNSVPTMWDSPSSPLPSAQSLRDELGWNDTFQDLLIFGDPYWLTARSAGSRHSSILVAFLDEDGSRFQRIVRNPPYLFGNRSMKPHKYVSRPFLTKCSCCLQLGHTASQCRSPPSVIVCPICHGGRREEEHHLFHLCDRLITSSDALHVRRMSGAPEWPVPGSLWSLEVVVGGTHGCSTCRVC